METTWFESWFDSPFYHLLYRDRNEQEARDFLNALLDRIHLPTASKVLDLACGKGRHSIYLNEKGFDVTGVDLSSANIRYCKQFENEQLHFFEHDMRRVIAINYFDVVVNLFTSFGYFDRDHENEMVVQAAAKSLQRGGYFIIDFLNVHKAVRDMIMHTSKTIEGITFYLDKEIKEGKIIKKIKFTEQGIEHNFSEEVRMLYPEDFIRFFAKSGLVVVETYGDYNLHPFHADSSSRLIFITRKI